MSQQWQQAAVYYYEEQKDQLILDCVQPLFQSLAPRIERAFFTRHWLLGPHLRLCFFCDEQEFEDVVRPAVEAQVGSYLKEHPSTTVLDEQRWHQAVQKLARFEQEQGPLFPLYPDNSIQYSLYDRRLHVLRDELLADLIEQFYVESNELTLKMLEYVRQGHSRLLLALQLMFATAHKTVWPVTTGFISYRSHAEGMIMWSPDPQAVRRLFEQKYASQSQELTTLLKQVVEALDENQDTFPFVLPWTALLRRYWEYGAPLIANKELNIRPSHTMTRQEFEERIKNRLAYSEFHTHFHGNPTERDQFLADPVFQSYRLMLNLLYLHLNRLGIRPFERALLGHLAANTVEEVFAVSALPRPA